MGPDSGRVLGGGLWPQPDALFHSFDELQNGHVNELVLSFILHHSRPLVSHHLHRAVYVDLAIEAFLSNLVQNHVDYYERPSSSYSGRAVNADHSLRRRIWPRHYLL